MAFDNAQKVVVAVAFCIALAAMFALHAHDGLDAAKSAYSKDRASGFAASAAQFETVYNAGFADDREWVNLYGLANRALGKREVADYQVVRDDAGSLYAQEASWFSEAPANAAPGDVAGCVAALRDAAEGAGGQLLFVQCPYKTADDAPELADYVRPGLAAQFDETLEALRGAGVDCLDLRDVAACRSWYRTDHHWTCDAAFAAAGEIARAAAGKPELAELSGCVGLLDASEYERVGFGEHLLGSAGVKVGEWYAGMDDFSYLAPTFETDLEYRHYKDGAEDAHFEGSFEEAFIDLALLDDPDYYNKYNAFLHGGYVENFIVNRSAPNGLKCLLVAHSYGRPMAQYLSLAFAETRYLDPQEGRFEGDIAAYVRDWRPDVVIVMYNNTFNVG